MNAITELTDFERRRLRRAYEAAGRGGDSMRFLNDGWIVDYDGGEASLSQARKIIEAAKFKIVDWQPSDFYAMLFFRVEPINRTSAEIVDLTAHGIVAAS